MDVGDVRGIAAFCFCPLEVKIICGCFRAIFKVQTVHTPGPGCSKLTMSLVNISLLEFQTLISQLCQKFLSKKCEKLLQCKSFSHFFNKKFQCIWLLSSKTHSELTS